MHNSCKYFEATRTENGVRKYGFHRTSHRYITERLKGIYGENVNAIICHIGSGASISCIKDGKCYDTSMGLTPWLNRSINYRLY